MNNATKYSSAIAAALDIVSRRFPDRWRLRRSGSGELFGAISETSSSSAFTCPEQLGKLSSCAVCGLCFKARKPVRFLDHAAPLLDGHTALEKGRSRFQGKLTGLNPLAEKAALKPSSNAKLGKRADGKAWGFPEDRAILTLTLEERATCPTTCPHWADCYGNNMHAARRLAHGADLMTAIERDLDALDGKPVLIRLHVLGDFYSTKYVAFWARMLATFPNVAIFGYTAHPIDNSHL